MLKTITIATLSMMLATPMAAHAQLAGGAGGAAGATIGARGMGGTAGTATGATGGSTAGTMGTVTTQPPASSSTRGIDAPTGTGTGTGTGSAATSGTTDQTMTAPGHMPRGKVRSSAGAGSNVAAPDLKSPGLNTQGNTGVTGGVSAMPGGTSAGASVGTTGGINH